MIRSKWNIIIQIIIFLPTVKSSNHTYFIKKKNHEIYSSTQSRQNRSFNLRSNIKKPSHRKKNQGAYQAKRHAEWNKFTRIFHSFVDFLFERTHWNILVALHSVGVDLVYGQTERGHCTDPTVCPEENGLAGPSQAAKGPGGPQRRVRGGPAELCWYVKRRKGADGWRAQVRQKLHLLALLLSGATRD